MSVKTNTSEAPSLLDAVKARSVKRGKPPYTFEKLKPLVQAMIEGESIASLSKRLNINYQTLNKQKIAALQFLDKDDASRVLTAEDEAWVNERLEIAKQKEDSPQ